jgi:hypothetical protein
MAYIGGNQSYLGKNTKHKMALLKDEARKGLLLNLLFR